MTPDSIEPQLPTSSGFTRTKIDDGDDDHQPHDPQLPPSTGIEEGISRALAHLDNNDTEEAKTILRNLINS